MSVTIKAFWVLIMYCASGCDPKFSQPLAHQIFTSQEKCEKQMAVENAKIPLSSTEHRECQPTFLLPGE